ncbi:MAG: DUF4276 family protein [Deltaproteobacteria bacterium]|nr:DUF4276 family protein [Deltaproteobacteria bacterium]
MIRLVLVVEGQTEQAFVREVLGPALAMRGVYATGRLVGVPGRKGGNQSAKAERDIALVLSEDRTVRCSTMFDLYGLSPSFPGVAEHHDRPPLERARWIENALLERLRAARGEDAANRFVPYIQIHEFEALLFSDPEKLAQVLEPPSLARQLHALRGGFGSPEDIDRDQPPSKRILSFHPSYQKVHHGTRAAIDIGVEAMRSECPHFNEWLSRLEALNGPD